VAQRVPLPIQIPPEFSRGRTSLVSTYPAPAPRAPPPRPAPFPLGVNPQTSQQPHTSVWSGNSHTTLPTQALSSLKQMTQPSTIVLTQPRAQINSVATNLVPSVRPSPSTLLSLSGRTVIPSVAPLSDTVDEFLNRMASQSSGSSPLPMNTSAMEATVPTRTLATVMREASSQAYASLQAQTNHDLPFTLDEFEATKLQELPASQLKLCNTYLTHWAAYLTSRGLGCDLLLSRYDYLARSTVVILWYKCFPLWEPPLDPVRGSSILGKFLRHFYSEAEVASVLSAPSVKVARDSLSTASPADGRAKRNHKFLATRMC